MLVAFQDGRSPGGISAASERIVRRAVDDAGKNNYNDQ